MKFTRGNTFKPTGNPAKRPPKLKGRVANDLWPNPARSAAGPPPTKDTQEPIGRGISTNKNPVKAATTSLKMAMSSMGKGRGKGVHKSGQGGRIS
jgi:hypothetical protein